MPSVQSFYQILSQLTVLLYLIMYMLMFAAAIALRYKMKGAVRPFRLGRGNALMWLIAGVGFAGSLLAFSLSFIPPSQIATGSHTVWYGVLVAGCVIMVAIPLIIYAMRKPSWRDANAAADFAPFHWEQPSKPAQPQNPNSQSAATQPSAPTAAPSAAQRKQNNNTEKR